MNYLITYETENNSGYPKTIIIHDVPQWVKDNPKCYITVCQPLSNGITLTKKQLQDQLNSYNTRGK